MSRGKGRTGGKILFDICGRCRRPWKQCGGTCRTQVDEGIDNK